MANQEKMIVSEDTIPQTEVNEAFDTEKDLACSADAVPIVRTSCSRLRICFIYPKN